MLLDALPEPTPIAQLSGREGELRYVTQNFQDLKGLQLVPFWSGMLAIFQVLPHGHTPLRIVLPAFAIVIMLTFLWASWISRWYKERYGFIAAVKSHPEQVSGAGLVWIVCLILLFALTVSSRTLPGYIPLINTTLVFLVPKCLQACPRSAAVHFRRASYTIAASASIGVAVYASFYSAHSSLGVRIMLASLLLLGLYDHWLLGFLLRPRSLQVREAPYE